MNCYIETKWCEIFFKSKKDSRKKKITLSAGFEPGPPDQKSDALSTELS